MCIWWLPLKVCACWALEGRLLAPWWWWSRRVCMWWWKRHKLSASCNWGILIKAELTGQCHRHLALLWRWTQRAETEVAAVVIPFTGKQKQNDHEFKISKSKLCSERCSPVRFLGLSGRRGCRLGGKAAECTGDKGVSRWSGCLGESGLIGARVCVRSWGSSLVGDWTEACVASWILEREDTLQDLRRGKPSVGWAWLWERVLGIWNTHHWQLKNLNNPLKLNRKNILVGQVWADDGKKFNFSRKIHFFIIILIITTRNYSAPYFFTMFERIVKYMITLLRLFNLFNSPITKHFSDGAKWIKELLLPRKATMTLKLSLKSLNDENKISYVDGYPYTWWRWCIFFVFRRQNTNFQRCRTFGNEHLFATYLSVQRMYYCTNGVKFTFLGNHGRATCFWADFGCYLFSGSLLFLPRLCPFAD